MRDVRKGSLDSFRSVGAVDRRAEIPSGLRFDCGKTTVEVAALAPDLWRVGMFLEGKPPEYLSEAIARSEWDAVDVDVSDHGSSLTLTTQESAAHIGIDPLRVSFSDGTGRSFCADDPDLGMGSFPSEHDEATPYMAAFGAPVRMFKHHPKEQHYFGCGERTSGLDKTGSHQIYWNIDPPIGHTAASNNLYTSIPMVMALEDGRAWGMFFDNTHRVEIDLAKEDEGLCHFAADGGPIVYYVFTGPAPRDVVRAYTELTGRTPMPPLWSLGNQQSRYSYMDADELRAVARTLRERDIPCDTLYLDIDYMDGYRVFTWDAERFPEPAKLVSDLSKQGFHVVTIVDPGVKVDEGYSIYNEGRAARLFCRDGHGDEFHNVVWPGLCAFPDFTNPATRTWWGDNHEVLVEAGISGIWCDMNEPALFVPLASTMPEDVVHDGGGSGALHGQVHNTYGSLMARSTREGLERLRPDRRPFVITRAGYAGLQRHALQWTGDNCSWWEHLWMAMPQLQNLGLSGVAWSGVDVGGFWGDSSGELLARWTELGAFQPLCRNHSAKGTVHQEPWAFGEPYESVCRAMLKLRQRLIPYLYTLFEECHRTGAPILRPLLFEHPGDATTYYTDDELMLGPALLIAPVTRPGIEHRHVYLPEGTWWHLWSGDRIEGPAHILAHAPLGEPPVYVRANLGLPLWPDMAHTEEHAPDPLTILLYPAEGRGETTLYEDAGDGYDFEAGVYARTSIVCTAGSGTVTVDLGGREGTFAPDRREVRLDIRGLQFEAATVEVDGVAVSPQRSGETLVVALEESASARRVVVRA